MVDLHSFLLSHQVPSKQPTAVFFSIKPKVIKDVMLKVRASIPNVPYDEVQRPLPVKVLYMFKIFALHLLKINLLKIMSYFVNEHYVNEQDAKY